MEIILMENVARLGKCGEVVKVKDGFARNYLIPKGSALEANESNLKVFAQRKAGLEKADLKKKAVANDVLTKLEALSLTIPQEAKEDEELYGSVTVATVCDALEKEGFTVKTDEVIITEPIKKLGVYQVRVRLHPEVEGEIKVWVVKK